MAPNTADTAAPESQQPQGAPSIPTWINAENFEDIIREMSPAFKRIVKFEPVLTGGAGENYASVLMRIKVTVEVEGSTNCVCCYGTVTKDLAFIIKILPQAEKSSAMINMMGLFPKESLMYNKYFPAFEQMYAGADKTVNFGPKHFTLHKDPGVTYILLEDLSLRGFKNANRLEGFDQDHTESVLRLLADLHAVSAVQYETNGPYEEIFSKGAFNDETRAMVEGMIASMKPVKTECFSKYNITPACLDKITTLTNKTMELLAKCTKTDPNEFNVINHGDLWANNIMFRYDDEDKLEETIFVDLQISRYGPPVIDLFYFLMSSVKLELKCSMFDHFIKYYHTHLIENLKLLKYPKKIPTMKDLRTQILRYGYLAFSSITGVMPAVLLDPTDSANIEAYMGSGDEAMKFKRQMFGNARYTKHMETILPWLETRGLLDE